MTGQPAAFFTANGAKRRSRGPVPRPDESSSSARQFLTEFWTERLQALKRHIDSTQTSRYTGDRQEGSMAKYVISYRAPKDYVPGREDDMAAWAAWFTSIGEDLVDFGSAVRDTVQIGDCGAGQRLRGYSVISADSPDAALLVAQGCPGLKDTGFGVEVGVVEETPG